MIWRTLIAVAGFIGAIAATSDVRACGTCDAGDPTLTVSGVEVPVAGRLRSSLEVRRRTDSVGSPGVDETKLEEIRADVSTIWAPAQQLTLLAQIPFMYRDVRDASLARHSAWGLGDIELRLKWFAFRDRAFAPRVLIALLGGVKLPTAPWQLDALGNPLPLEAQPGTGSFDLLVGPALALFSGDWSAYLSASFSEPVVTRSGVEPGRSLRGSVAVQYQLATWVAARVALDTRWARASRENGVVDPNSGGYIVFGGGDLMLSPIVDWSVLVGLRLPVVNGLNGAHEEGPIASLALLHDW